MPNGRCYLHGGPTPAGIASPHFRHGQESRYLKHLPQTLAPHFDPFRSNLVALTEELALVDAQMVDLFDTLKTHRLTASARKQLADLIERKARLVAVESRRRKDEHEMVERAEFARFAKALLVAVATRIDDRDIRGKIQEDVLRILAISQVPMIADKAS